MEEEGYGTLPTSHLLGSVPAVISDEKKPSLISEGGASASNFNVFPPAGRGHPAPGSGNPSDGNDQSQPDWKGFFSISSYSPFFNVDTDVVVDRMISSVFPKSNFFSKIDANPDLYGPVWISTTLVFMLAALGNTATYMIQKKSDPTKAWNFDVGYFNWSASVIYGYSILVPLGFYFLLQYFGTQSSLVRFWCMWGYSLFIFIPSSLLLIIPVEFLRWIIILLAGSASSWFVSSNLKYYVEGIDRAPLVVGALVLQFALAVFIKVLFFD
ncbi:integral membrane Yip1 family protein [Carex rostrata]